MQTLKQASKNSHIVLEKHNDNVNFINALIKSIPKTSSTIVLN